MATYRVLVTGSRTWTDIEAVRREFQRVVDENVLDWPVVLVHGDARGLDKMAAQVAAWEFGWRVEPYPAQWRVHDYTHTTHPCPAWHEGAPSCKMAGHRRNADMVSLRADLCLAFIRNNSPGATGCAALAQKAGIPTIRTYQDD